MAEGVLEQCPADPNHPLFVTHCRDGCAGLDLERPVAGLRKEPELVREQACGLGKVDGAAFHVQTPRIEAREVEKVGREPR